MARRNFCEINPFFYELSVRKGIIIRHLKNAVGRVKFAKNQQSQKLPVVVSSHSSGLIKRAPGIDLTLQLNKAVNIEIACKTINGLVIHPGETFSFWKRIGNTTKRKGYKDGRVFFGDKLTAGIGGGLCNLSNTIHLLVLHSPLTVTEFHSHSDALAPDGDKRIPFSSGTSVSYNYIDYRFRNDTDVDFQLLAWCENEKLYAELRSVEEMKTAYELLEEGHHFRKEGEKFYRDSKIYKLTKSRETGEILQKELVRDNHSEVLLDYSLIPKDQIKE